MAAGLSRPGRVTTANRLRKSGSPKKKNSIGERVQFWEEQDKINQQLIPRVIRQHEILENHLQNHPDIPQISAAVDRALAHACKELRKAYKKELASAHELWQAESRKQCGRYQDALAATSREFHQTLQDAESAANISLRREWQESLRQAIARHHHEPPRGLHQLHPIVKITLLASTLISISSIALIIYLLASIR